MVLAYILMGVVLAGDGEPPAIERYAEWGSTPPVVVCPDFPGSLEDAKQAAREVEAHGGRFAGIARGDCRMMPLEEIHLHGPAIEMPPNTPGITIPVMEDRKGDRPILHGAIIFVQAGWGGSVVVRHELMHALGLDHAKAPGHVMTPTLEVSGEDWTGVRSALGD